MNKAKVFMTAWILFLGLTGCAPQKPAIDISRISGVRAVSLEEAKWLSAVPGKVIPNNGTLKVIFAKDMVTKDQVGQAVTKRFFSFEPKLSGKAAWTSANVLEYMPDQVMPSFKFYQGTLYLDEITMQPSTKPLTFTFETVGNEVVKLDGGFLLVQKDQQLQYCLKGLIEFSEEVEKKTLGKSLRLTHKGWDVPLTVTGGDKGLSFEFETPLLSKARFDKAYTMTIKSKKLNLISDIKRDFLLTKKQPFKVKSIEQLQEEKQIGFLARLTDTVSKDQNIDGFVKIEPQVKTKVKAADDKLYMYGEFSYGTNYHVTVKAGLKNAWGEASQKDFETIYSFKDIKPALKIDQQGVFLPSSNQSSITFQTINLKKVHIKVFKVFANNLGQFIQSDYLHQSQENTRYGWSYNHERVGVEVKKQTLDIGDEKNKWLTHKLDLKKALVDKRGLYLISLSFTKKDSLYVDTEQEGTTEERDEYYYGDDYYTSPNKEGYYENHGNFLLPIILSDIGLTVKKGDRQVQAFATNLETTDPMPGVLIKLMTYQNQVIAQKKTDSQGKAVFEGVEQAVFYVEAEKNQQRSIVKFSEMEWNISGFDVGGIKQLTQGVHAFIYTDRGVYRPGDKIFVSMIVRNQQNTFPTNHPVQIKFFNPQNQLMNEQNIKKSTDGFYCFELKTGMEDLTGDWRIEVKAGASTFIHYAKIETVVPNRLKVIIEPQEETMADKKKITVDLNSTYLFGAPASGLKAEVEGVLEHRPIIFKDYPDYSFNHEGVSFRPYRAAIISDSLNEKGTLKADWMLPDLSAAPSGIRARIKAKVFEKGGRFTEQQQTIDIDPHSDYVGLKQKESGHGYVQVPSTYYSKVILVDQSGRIQSGSTVHYRLYRNQEWWWWEVQPSENRSLKFKTNSATELVASGSLITRKQAVDLELKLEESGEYLLEVQDGHQGHTSGYFFHASQWWGDQGKKDAGTIVLKADKKKYHPGETAKVRFPAPTASRVLVSLEHGSEILDSWWVTMGTDNNQCVLDIPIKSTMLPTVYVSVSVIQKHDQTKNDMPIRLYGIIPLHVEDVKTRQALSIHMPDQLEPEEEFEVVLNSEDGKPFQASIAIVDVGLLDLTNYETPDPWEYFYQKLGLGVMSYDLYNLVIGANKDDIYKLFAIGGGGSIEKREAMLNPAKAERFKPVALFKGPLQSDGKGQIKTGFKLPNYIGAVKVMAIAANQQAYGHQDKVVPVKKDLMIQPTLPRVIGPKETFYLPVNVMTLKDGVGTVKISLETTGLLDVVGDAEQVLDMTKASDKLMRFQLKSREAIGKTRVKIKAVAEKLVAATETELAVRPSSPRQTGSEAFSVKSGETITLEIPGDGLEGTNQASITIQRLPKLNLKHRLSWLMRYPYGCLEQVTSSAFPQLFLKSFIKSSVTTEEKIDRNINAGIDKLQKFVLPSGGFAYWPGGKHRNVWANNYAGHFLVEAKKMGYHVPEHMLEKWIEYQQAQALKTDEDIKSRVYRTYVLALAGQPHLGAMNLLKENELKNMSNVEKWMLASAYQLAGQSSTARLIAEQATLNVMPYQELDGSFGTPLRDQAIILESLLMFDRMEEARQLFEIIAAAMSEAEWYGTQTVSYALLAMGKYLKKIDTNYSDQQVRMTGKIKLTDGKVVDFDTTELSYQNELDQGFGKKVQVSLDGKSKLGQAYVIMDWSGIPLVSEKQDYSKNLGLSLNWYDDQGAELDPTTVKQGQSFWGHIKVYQTSSERKELKNMALVQMVPSGWEIENLRMTGERLPDWVNRYEQMNYDYEDIRDDRLMWFFNLSHYGNGEFIFKVNAVTAGEFYLPATQVEAMYNHQYHATVGGEPVKVLKVDTK